MDELLGWQRHIEGDDDDDDDDEDLLELLDIEGDEDELIGAKGSKKRARLKRKLARKARGGVNQRRSSNRKGRLLLFGGQNTAVAVGSLRIATTVQEICRVDRLFISAINTGTPLSNAAFNVSDITVGVKSQLTALSPLPGILFTPDNTAMFQGLGFDTIQPGTEFSVLIQTVAIGDIFTFGAVATALR